jgi:hypothetical protein
VDVDALAGQDEVRYFLRNFGDHRAQRTEGDVAVGEQNKLSVGVVITGHHQARNDGNLVVVVVASVDYAVQLRKLPLYARTETFALHQDDYVFRVQEPAPDGDIGDLSFYIVAVGIVRGQFGHYGKIVTSLESRIVVVVAVYQRQNRQDTQRRNNEDNDPSSDIHFRGGLTGRLQSL